MPDLGTSFLASVERDPKALAIVDGDVRLTYDAWYVKISSLVAAFDDLGLYSRRSSGHSLAELMGGRDHSLGLSICRRHRNAAELAGKGRRNRFRRQGCRRAGDRLSGLNRRDRVQG